jgi:hypothetical protein
MQVDWRRRCAVNLDELHQKLDASTYNHGTPVYKLLSECQFVTTGAIRKELPLHPLASLGRDSVMPPRRQPPAVAARGKLREEPEVSIPAGSGPTTDVLQPNTWMQTTLPRSQGRLIGLSAPSLDHN